MLPTNTEKMEPTERKEQLALEELVFKKRFKGEEFNPENYIDWVSDNPAEAHRLSIQVANEEIESRDRLLEAADAIEKIHSNSGYFNNQKEYEQSIDDAFRKYNQLKQQSKNLKE